MLGGATLVSLVVTIIKRKLMAIYLGPSGLGIYAQVNNYFNVVTVIASFGLSQGITTFIARNDNASKSEVNNILQPAMSISLFLSLIIIIITISCSKTISALVLNNSSIYYLLIVAALAIPFQIFGQSLLSYLQAIKKIAKISLSSIVISVLGLIATIPLVVIFSTFGAVLSILILSIVTFIIYIYFCREKLELKAFFGIFNFLKMRKYFYFDKLINFGSLRFVQTVITWLTFFIMRTIIIKKLGMANNGIYEAVYTFSLLYLPFMSNILWSYSYPEYCQAKDDINLSKAVNKFLRLSMTVTFPVIVILLLARPILVEKIIFTGQFGSAINLIPLRLAVDLLTIITWSFSVALLAKERLGAIIKFELIKDILFLAAIMSVTSSFGLIGILLMDAVSCLLLSLLFYAYIKKHFKFELLGKNKHLLLSSLALLIVVSLFPVKNIAFIFIGLSILIAWLFYFVSRSEIKEILGSLRIIDA